MCCSSVYMSEGPDNSLVLKDSNFCHEWYTGLSLLNKRKSKLKSKSKYCSRIVLVLSL